jgi:dTDP-glucose 4,6-dehydratase
VAILITGGAGFIGSAFVHSWFMHSDEPAVTLDLLTYAGNADNFTDLPATATHTFVHGDIGDHALVNRVLAEYQPRAIVHLAAETHVDRSIKDAEAFLQTNVVGTGRLLAAATTYWRTLSAERQQRFRFLHVSTDEVFGSLAAEELPFSESSPYRPSSPYAASKAGSDHVASAWHVTHGLPVLTTHCSNNYGPRQFPEKLIPLCIARATAPCPGDFNRDGVVTGADLGVLLGAWGASGGDLNADGVTNGADLGILLGEWGACN